MLAPAVVLCAGCSTVLCPPTGGKARLTEDAPAEGSSTKGTLNQNEWETIPINTFFKIKNKRTKHQKLPDFRCPPTPHPPWIKLDLLGMKTGASQADPFPLLSSMNCFEVQSLSPAPSEVQAAERLLCLVTALHRGQGSNIAQSTSTCLSLLFSHPNCARLAPLKKGLVP